jgi:hypothetical protein
VAIPIITVTLPFTRMLARPIDYTPASFHNVTREDFVLRMASMTMGRRVCSMAGRANLWPSRAAPAKTGSSAA